MRSFLVLGTTLVVGFAVPAYAQEPQAPPKTAPSAQPPPKAAPSAAPAPSSSGSGAAGEKAAPKTPNRTDTVRLRNGGFHRGRVTEIVPEDHVTIVQLDGEKKEIPWADIDRVVIGGPPPARAPGAPTAGATTTTPETKPAPKSPLAGPLAKVHLVGPSRVVLYRRPAGSSQWELACDSPCDDRLPIGDDYRVTGNGIAQSEEFKLMAPADGSVYINVHSSNAGRVLGGVLASVGALVGYIGLLVALSNSSSFEKKDRTSGLVALGVGSAAAVAGIVIFLVTGGTDVTQTPQKEAKVKLPLPLATVPLDAFLREPMWKSEKSSTTTIASDPAAFTAPAAFPILFTKQF